MTGIQPRLQALPVAARQFWRGLRAVPPHFVLYGGTALTLRLGHRPSMDFNFFTAIPFDPDQLERGLGWGDRAMVRQKAQNFLNLSTAGAQGVRLCFFGGSTFGQVEPADKCTDNGIFVAGLKDLMATKLHTVCQRAEFEDYLDLDALLRAGFTLALGLAWARAIYRHSFNPLLPLKALTFFEDGDLYSLSPEVKQRLRQAAETVGDIPQLHACSDRIATAES